MNDPDRVDEAEALLPAPPERIFAAFCDPERVARWMPPEGMRAEVERWRVEPGGSYLMTLVYTGEDHPEGKAGGGRDEVEGCFGEVEPPHRVVQDARFPSDDPANIGTMRLEWRFAAEGDRTRASVRATSVPPAIDAADHRKALGDTLRQLGEAAAHG